ncbi:MAG: AAA family ATPase [Clostridiaceae bacterium]|nr:AAA family ATPase [Clostridiaceae bacterium]
MTFDNIYGHDGIKQTLNTAIDNNTVSHAYVFCGKKGIGKTTMATAFAQLLTHNSVADIIVVTNEHYDVKEKKALSVDAIRAARTDIYIKPYIADKKVFIIPDADTMSAGAQNALLKVLEEPPAYCVIILISANDRVLLPTILSRAVILRFAPLDDGIISQYIKDKYKDSIDSILIRLCSGSLSIADELITTDGLRESIGEYAALFKRFVGADKACIYEAIAFFEQQKQNCFMFFDIMSILLSDSLIEKSQTNGMKGINKGAALKIINNIAIAKNAINQNRNYGIVISELLLDAWRALHD